MINLPQITNKRDAVKLFAPELVKWPLSVKLRETDSFFSCQNINMFLCFMLNAMCATLRCRNRLTADILTYKHQDCAWLGRFRTMLHSGMCASVTRCAENNNHAALKRHPGFAVDRQMKLMRQNSTIWICGKRIDQYESTSTLKHTGAHLLFCTCKSSSLRATITILVQANDDER